jgi:tetratricopeptide (TPR) repeat protein
LRKFGLLILLFATLGGASWLGYGAFVRARGSEIVGSARRMLASGRGQEARQALEPLLYFQPSHAEARLIEGMAFRQEGNLVAAEETLRQVSRHDPRHRAADFELALVLLQRGRLDLAEEVLVRHVAQYPQHIPAVDELRWLYFNTFRARHVEQLLESRLEKDPGDVDALRHLLMTEFRGPVPREGIGYLEQIDREAPGQPEILRGLAWCHWQLGAPAEAQRKIDAALQSAFAGADSRREILLLALAFLVDQGEVAGARALVEDVDRAAGEAAGGSALIDDDRWWWSLSNLEERSGNTTAALELLNRALHLRPFELKYVHRRGILLQKLRRIDEAAVDFQRANVLEGCATRLTEIVLAGGLERLTAGVCRELAELSERRGRPLQKAGWQEVLRRNGALSNMGDSLGSGPKR